MLFSSVPFLYAFFIAVIAVYYAVPKKLKNLVLLIASLAFYFFGEPFYLIVMAASSLAGYGFGLLIHYTKGKKGARLSLWVSVVLTLTPLLLFKYGNFFIQNANALFGTRMTLLKLALPIGISFYTFQILSYIIDVYRGDARAQKNPVSFMAYVTMFPQLIAGPIVRYQTVQDELCTRGHTLADFSEGIRRFCIGLGKKVILADSLAAICESLTSADRSVLSYWVCAVAFTLQIYFDFSGYSDMAIGLGRMFGFHFSENFNYPFMSQTVTEFWRRWHISLGTWFRDYVYIPLGGNRCRTARRLFNIFIVWFLTGFWHGASWNFILWGLYFALLLLLEKSFLAGWLGKLPRIFRSIYLLAVVVFGFVLFNAASVPDAATDLFAMFGGGGLPVADGTTLYALGSNAVLLIISAVGSTSLPATAAKKLRDSRYGKKLVTILEPLFCSILLVIVTAYLVDGSFSPFLYFRF